MIQASLLNQTHLAVPGDQEVTLTHTSDKLSSFLKVSEKEWLVLLRKCRSVADLKQAHAQVVKLGLFHKPFCASNLVSVAALADWGSIDYACAIFDQIEEPGSFEFNAVIKGYAKEMRFVEALWLYQAMVENGVEPDQFTYPALLKGGGLSSDAAIQVHGHVLKFGFAEDLFVQTSLISLYGRCGEVELSRAVFGEIGVRNVACWSALISANARCGLWDECLEVFGEMMREGVCRAEESALVSVVSACTHLGALELGMCAHGLLLRNVAGLNVAVQTSLIDMYVKCGAVDKGMDLFRKLERRNLLSYSVMISGLAIHGRGEEALNVFSQLLAAGLEPDHVAFVGVLSACSHAGLVDEGLKYFGRMRNEFGIQPTIQHYGCLVDLMSRAGMTSEALALIQSMPMEPNDVCWRSLLSSCRVHRDLDTGEVAAKQLHLLNTENAGDYMLLASIYSQAQRWDDVARIQTEMARKGRAKTPGYCLVEVKRRVYKFFPQEKSYPKCEGVYEMIHQMEWQLRFEGYNADTTQVLLDVDEEEKKERLSAHCQKLAIAFALLHTSEGSPIRLARNLRMCSDCHRYTELISVIFGREIIVRDRNRFHHFKNGTCSCKNYW
uniref:DYW domain-containing protein n=1 Tax=Kalanchoe fedtschenkoi TaxID=63787 RepID=A0A7N0U0P5_KALFE